MRVYTIVQLKRKYCKYLVDSLTGKYIYYSHIVALFSGNIENIIPVQIEQVCVCVCVCVD